MELAPDSWPQICLTTGKNIGPLPTECGCGRLHQAEQREGNIGAFKPKSTAAWPDAFNRWVAIMAYNWGMGRLCAARMQGEQSAKFAPYQQITITDEDATSDEDSDGEPIPRKGAGWWGHEPPMATLATGRYKAFADGNGLCKPGRWEPQKRKPVQSPMADELF